MKDRGDDRYRLKNRLQTKLKRHKKTDERDLSLRAIDRATSATVHWGGSFD